jgi:hypothetical protein
MIDLTQDFGTQSIDKIWLLNAPLSKKNVSLQWNLFPAYLFTPQWISVDGFVKQLPSKLEVSRAYRRLVDCRSSYWLDWTMLGHLEILFPPWHISFALKKLKMPLYYTSRFSITDAYFFWSLESRRLLWEARCL